jgi:hypothetical protein
MINREIILYPASTEPSALLKLWSSKIHFFWSIQT